MSAWPVTGETSFLIGSGLLAHRGVEGQRPVENAARDLAAVGHLAQRGRVERGLDLGIHGFDGRQQSHFGLGDAQRVRQVDGVLHDVDLVFELGRDVDGRVGNEQGARIGRRIHDEDVRDAPRRAQAGIALHGGLEQLVGVQAALHQRLRIARAANHHGRRGRLGLGFGFHNGKFADVDAELCGKGFHGRFRADESGLDETGGSGFHCALQRHLAQRPHHGRGDGGQRFAALDEFMKDVIIRGMPNKWVDGNGFSQRGKIAHEFHSPPRQSGVRRVSVIIVA